MAGRISSRILVKGALIALVFTPVFAPVFAWPALSCPSASERTYADSAPAEKSKTERCKRSDKMRAPSKDCPDGGERLPQDKRSPLDKIPPLSPLVA
jgi:hypothetical protein